MTGQCEFHPFEHAVDVCDVCFADICAGCVTRVRSRQESICRDCAIILSGVRGGTKTPVRGDKSTVAARRAALQPQEPEVDNTEVDETEWIRDEAGGIRNRLSAMASGFLPGGSSKSKTVATPNRSGASTSRTKKSPEAGYGEDSAVHKLDQLRRGEAPQPEPADVPPWEPESDQFADRSVSTEAHDQSAEQPDQSAPTGGPTTDWPELRSDGGEGTPDQVRQPGWEVPPDRSRRVDDRSDLGDVNEAADESTEETSGRWSELTAPDLSQDPFASRR